MTRTLKLWTPSTNPKTPTTSDPILNLNLTPYRLHDISRRCMHQNPSDEALPEPNVWYDAGRRDALGFQPMFWSGDLYICGPFFKMKRSSSALRDFKRSPHVMTAGRFKQMCDVFTLPLLCQDSSFV